MFFSQFRELNFAKVTEHDIIKAYFIIISEFRNELTKEKVNYSQVTTS